MSAPRCSSAMSAREARPLRIRGTAYPVLLPTLRDPRLHLAGVIVTLQVLGQTAFDFDALDRPDPRLARARARSSRWRSRSGGSA